MFWGEREWRKDGQEKELSKDAVSGGDELASDFIGSGPISWTAGQQQLLELGSSAFLAASRQSSWEWSGALASQGDLDRPLTAPTTGSLGI